MKQGAFNRVRVLVWLLASAALIHGCSHERTIFDAETVDHQLSGPVEQGLPAVKILPDAPTVVTDLQVVHSVPGYCSIAWFRNDEMIVGQNSERLLKTYFRKGDVIRVTVSAGGMQESASTIIANSPPHVVSIPFHPRYIHAGENITVSPVAFDPDGDEVQFRYRWKVNGYEVPEDSSILDQRFFRRGDIITLAVLPYDDESDGEPFQSRIIVIPNAPPKFSTEPPKSFRGETFAYHVTATDPDGDRVAYSLSAAPSGMRIDPDTGILTWKIDEHSTGIHNVAIIAHDPEGFIAIQQFTLSISLSEEVM